MFPTLQLRGFPLSMTWLGIVAFLIVFVIAARKRSHHLGLPFRELFRYLPGMIALAYLFWTRSRYAFEYFLLIPFSPQELLLYLSPYEFHFHFVGVIGGLLIGWRRFLKSQPRERYLSRHTVIFEASMLACIPLGIFLLFGDHFIGKPIETGIFVSAIDPLSKVAAYDTVIPLGIYLSCLAGLLYLFISVLHTWKRDTYRIFLGFGLFFLWVGTLAIRQIYPRHLVMKFLWLTIDIKQYLCIGIALLSFWQHSKFHSFVSPLQPIHETDLHPQR